MVKKEMTILQQSFNVFPSETFLETNRSCAPVLFQTLTTLRPIVTSLFQIFEYSVQGLYLTDENGILLYFNHAYEQMTGMRRQDIEGQHYQNFIDKGDVPYSIALVTLERKAPVTADIFYHKTGRLITVSTTPIFDADGSISAVIGNLTDITSLIHVKEPALIGELSVRKPAVDLKNSSSMIANDQKMQWILYYAYKAAKSNATVLITGETGTGKEEMAKFIHENSSRSSAPLIQVNCGAIPENLIESELFGYVGGAFTGASPQGSVGLFEAANGGTIFLDEIGELPYSVQAKLLRVLQQRTLTRIGSTKPIKLDIRVITATNRDLLEMISKKQFREDLYYRLNVVSISIPPLRERKADIFPLCTKFLANASEEYGKQFTLSPAALTILENYSWPGNIRELKNIIERAAISCEGDVITEELFMDTLPVKISPFASEWMMDLPTHLQQIEYSYLEQYYDHYGTIRDAANALGLNRSTFARRRAELMKKFKNEEAVSKD